MEPTDKSILIMGTRGVPAAHGGFETFAERFALFLAERGWKVSVYCQEDVAEIDDPVRTERWRGITRIIVQTARKGGWSALDFDLRCVRDALRRPGLCLVLGYNGAAFLPMLRLAGRKIFTNMDGIEWKRPKWSLPVRSWFYLNEWIAAWTSQRLVADHPAIADHLSTRRSRSAIAVIPYGGVAVEAADPAPLEALGLTPGGYYVSISRIEPDNNIATLVEAFSCRPRGRKLVVLGHIDDENDYHYQVRAAAGPDVVFPGAIYDPQIVGALRAHARAYLHGHTVGGTNPSLVESLWAGNAVLAHDNVYNRWTASDAALFFGDAGECAASLDRLDTDDALVAQLGIAARERAQSAFNWDDVLMAYERECLDLLAPAGGRAAHALEPAASRWA